MAGRRTAREKEFHELMIQVIVISKFPSLKERTNSKGHGDRGPLVITIISNNKKKDQHEKLLSLYNGLLVLRSYLLYLMMILFTTSGQRPQLVIGFVRTIYTRESRK